MGEPDVIPAHLIPRITNRGFKHLPGLPSTYVGGQVRLYESSAALEPCMWILVRDRVDLSRPVRPMRVEGGLSVVETTAHLSLETAKKLRDQLDYLITHHYQLEQQHE
jgi:hypothetical protein